MHTTEALPMTPAEAAVAATEDTWSVRDGTRLHTYRWSSDAAEQQSGAVLVIAHGYSEYGRRYDGLARHLVSRGHPTYAYDFRGHGFSPGQRGHIDHYARYVQDCTDIAREVARRHPRRPLVLLGHSNGGLTVLRTVQRGEIAPAALIMTCPMLALKRRHRPLSRRTAGLLALLVGRLPLPNGIDSRELTHDQAINQAWSNDPMNHGKSTPRWYVSALDAMAQAHAEAGRVTLPLLTLTAELDPVVDSAKIAQLVERTASADREVVVCRGALHEVLQEVDRQQTYKLIGDWLAKRFGG